MVTIKKLSVTKIILIILLTVSLNKNMYKLKHKSNYNCQPLKKHLKETKQT